MHVTDQQKSIKPPTDETSEAGDARSAEKAKQVMHELPVQLNMKLVQITTLSQWCPPMCYNARQLIEICSCMHM
jgi:hypothetical protein